MKNSFLLITAITLFTTCKNSQKADTVETAEKQESVQVSGENYSLDSASIITWTGSKPTQHHTGTFKLKDGKLYAANNVLTGGSFVIDITSLTDTDIKDGADKAKLEGHLKSPDFFDVAVYPTAKFEITSVTPISAEETNKALLKDATHTINGNFTLKDSTKNISFPARVTIDDKTATASAEFKMDRSQWGLNYKGPNHPQDWFIRKEVNIKLNISATKK
ncbi:MAG: YceI family protein [Chitinophagaceae bacterium]|nr:YceI family protein [Chitinophagaceae bacterium]